VANLVDNAIKYATVARPSAASSDTTAPSSGVIRVALAVEHDEALITVADRGPGIPAADRERALRRFVRLDASRTQPGTGLGLSLVAAVARLHGGRGVLSNTISETEIPGIKTPRTNMPGLTVRLALPGTLLVRGAAASDAQAEADSVGTVALDASPTTDVRNADMISVAGAHGVGHNARA
jgi:signal transduction histidine kinase